MYLKKKMSAFEATKDGLKICEVSRDHRKIFDLKSFVCHLISTVFVLVTVDLCIAFPLHLYTPIFDLYTVIVSRWTPPFSGKTHPLQSSLSTSHAPSKSPNTYHLHYLTPLPNVHPQEGEEYSLPYQSLVLFPL